MACVGSSGIRSKFISLAIALAVLVSVCAAEPHSISETEFNKLLNKAENGSLNAQAQVAKAYAVGRTGSINYEEAARWYHRAADQGDPD